MWDETYGGFYMLRDRQGDSVRTTLSGGKSAYGNTFALFALSSYYAMSGGTSALHLAQRSFFWLDKHSRDEKYKGYFDRLTRRNGGCRQRD
jgi:mannobiose 2-epimerase